MVKCTNCFNADRNPETGQRTIFEEPDILARIVPGTEPPKVRVIKSCGVGAGYWKTYGIGEHNCTKFEDATEREEEARAKLREVTKDLNIASSRLKLPVTTNALVLIAQMTEGSQQAYSILVDAMVYGFPYLSRLIMNLNDMNMRGEQIVKAFEWAGDVASLSQAAEDRTIGMVDYVNINCDCGDKGEAVQRYAADLAHKDKPDGGNKVREAGSRPKLRLKLSKGKHKASYD